MTLGENLRRLRKERGLSQMKLRDLAGVSQQAISEIETGHRDPYQSTLVKLAEALGASIADLYAEEPAPKGPPPPPKTPRTDERQEEFVARFDAAGEIEAGALRRMLDGELTGLQRYVHQLRDLGMEDEDFALRMAQAKLSRCVRRLHATTRLWTELGLGRERKSFRDYAGEPDELERWLRIVLREEPQQSRLFNNGTRAG